jgi:DNA-binding NarL/FixJ family response regulator
MLDLIDGVEVSGEAESPASAIEGILATRPDFVVLDYQLLGGTGVDVLQGTISKLTNTTFIVLSNHTNPQYRRLCLGAGAKYYFDKSEEFSKVMDVIAASEASI